MGTQKLDTFLCDFCKLQERNHLEADLGVSWGGIVDKVQRVTDPPLSASISSCSAS